MSVISLLNGAGELPAFLRDCVQGAVLIALAWAVFRLVPRVPAAVRCLVWWMLCLKMLVGLVWLTAPVKIAVLPKSPPAPIPGSRLLTPPGSEVGGLHSFSLLSEGGVGGGSESSQGLTSPSLSLRKERDQSRPRWTRPLLTAWLCGAALSLTLLLLQFFKAARLRREASIAPPGRCWAAMTSAADEIGVTPRPPVLLSLHAPSPMTAGLLKPVVLLPGKDAFTLTDDELFMVLAHEAAHIRRRDLWLGLIPAAAQAVFFFHPLVRLAHREYLLAREEACDALALQATRLPADAYGRLLLRFGTRYGSGASAVVAITGSQAARALRRRLAVLGGAKPLSVRQRWAWTAGMCAFGILGLIPVALTERAAQAARPSVASCPMPISSHVAPETLLRAVHVASATLPMTAVDALPRLAQTPVEIHEIPQEIAVRPAPSHKRVHLREMDMVPTIPAIPPMHVNVPPMPAMAPMHITIPAFTVDVPAVHVSIPEINVATPAIPVFPGVHVSTRGFKEFRMGPSDLARLRQEMQTEAKRDRGDELRDKQEALREAAQDRAEALAETKSARDEALREAQQDAAEAREEVEQDAAEARQESKQDALDAQRDARQEAAEGLQSAHESMAQAEAELREELRDNTNGIARQALQQALTCLEKPRKTLPKPHGDQ